MIRVCMQVKELGDVTDKYIDRVLNKQGNECSHISE